MPAADAAPLLRSCAIPPEQKDLIAELLPLALEEWGVDPSVSPTACLCGIAGTWYYGIRQAVAALEATAKSREPGAGSPEPKAGSMEPGAGATVLNMPKPEGITA